MKINLRIINSFSKSGTGGNPAGVVLNADDLTQEQKQLIASTAGLSETSFVSQSHVADFKLEFFTPTKQIAHCGHATISTFWYLKSLNKIAGDESSKETIDGVRKIFFKGEEPFMEQLSPRFELVKDQDLVIKSLGTNRLSHDHGPIVGNTGNSFILVRLKEISDLMTLKPDFNLISEISSDHDSIGYYVYALSHDKSVIQTRMFGPFYGIMEESATGMAAGPLAAFLFPELKRNSFAIHQGGYMTPPSESRLNAIVNTTGESITSVLVGGSAYIDKTIEVEV